MKNESLISYMIVCIANEAVSKWMEIIEMLT